MISFDTFKIFPQDMQAEVLLQYGVYLELIRKTGQLNIELYALEDFYVELYFDQITGEPLFLRAFNSMIELEPYLALVEVENILEIH